MTIRIATTDDIATIQLITYKTWPDAYKNILPAEQILYMLDLLYSTEALKKQMSEDGHQFIICSEAGTPVAFASYSKLEGNVFKLHKLYALPSQQGKGTGKFLINHVIEETKKEGAEFLRLNVNRHNKARNFYDHLGFEIIAQEDIDIGNGFFMNDYVMEKKL